jgi:predicted nucleotide-binding protein
MSTDSKPTPVANHLQSVIVQAREFTAKPNLAVLGAQIWISRARAVLARIYGENTTEVDFWCPAQGVDPPQMTPQDKITSRLPQIERLAAILGARQLASKVFIGHGRSAEWLKLRIFLSQTLGLLCDEFNLEPTAGMQTASRIESMLTSARMAFLVMTAEDRQDDGTLRARENVVHEIGLFQAALGAKRAIVLLEHGCTRFSNLDGLTTINFPSQDIMARSEEIRGVLTRERLL